MPLSTKLDTHSILPLSCSRSGTCCHGKIVMLNPWELFCLAREKKMSTAAFSNAYCDYGGIQLRFDGRVGWKALQACSQYVEGFGCSVHLGRPLSCRLYPLGREIQNDKVHYMYQGNEFPCLEGCPEVTKLPYMSVAEYLSGQLTHEFEMAQDNYLNMMQDVADMAFVLLLDSGLAQSGGKDTLAAWRKLGNELPEDAANRIGHDWMNCLMLPDISNEDNNPIEFVMTHNDLFSTKVQTQYGNLQTFKELHEASVHIMRMALHLARGIGANPKILADYWVDIARNNGAGEK